MEQQKIDVNVLSTQALNLAMDNAQMIRTLCQLLTDSAKEINKIKGILTTEQISELNKGQ